MVLKYHCPMESKITHSMLVVHTTEHPDQDVMTLLKSNIILTEAKNNDNVHSVLLLKSTQLDQKECLIYIQPTVLIWMTQPTTSPYLREWVLVYTISQSLEDFIIILSR